VSATLYRDTKHRLCAWCGGFGGVLGVGEAVQHPFGEVDAVMLDEPVPVIADAQDRGVTAADRRQPDREAPLVPAEPPRAQHRVSRAAASNAARQTARRAR
jgi:hypothetical protein